MVKVLLHGTLKTIAGKKELIIKTKRLSNLLKQLKTLIPDLLNHREKISATYLFLLNGKDIRLYEDEDIVLNENDEIEIIPVSHGG